MKKKTTIYTLAEELGVNPTTISRALNNSTRISPKRRKEIKELAQERGFKLRDFSPRITNLCVIICTESIEEHMFSTYTEQIISGVSRYCSGNNLELSIFSATTDRLNQIDTVKELFRRDASGAILINTRNDASFIESFEKEKLPYCCLLSGNPNFPDKILTVNNTELAEKAVDYLIQLGHRHIGFLRSDLHNQAQLDRLKGYCQSITSSGIPLNKKYISTPASVPERSGIEYGLKTSRHLLERNPEITAFLASNVDLAEGVRSTLYRRNLRIPDDLSLIACDDSPQAEFFCPPLTIIDIPNFRLGETAAAWVHQQIEGNALLNPPKELWMEGQLIIRGTTDVPRKNRLL